MEDNIYKKNLSRSGGGPRGFIIAIAMQWLPIGTTESFRIDFKVNGTTKLQNGSENSETG